MMIANDVAAAELNKLNGLEYRPKDKDARQAVVEALAYISDNHEQCRKIVNEWLRNHVHYPRPAELYRLGKEIRERVEAESVPGGCEKCQFTGYRILQHIVTGDYSGVAHCTCDKGWWLAAKWKERKGGK